MNNEPVAYGRYIENAKMWLVVELDSDMPEGYIPLYTHPVKELTEWEMKECWEEATEGQEHFCSQYFYFAQLILRKAQEK